jgi:ParB family chromosome partitioning protein
MDGEPSGLRGRKTGRAPAGRAPEEARVDRPGVVSIPLRDIRINLANPRKQIDEQELEELAASIRVHGLLQPILVRPLEPDERRQSRRKYQIVIGSRRFHAAERAGLREIDCYIRGMSSDDAVIASFLDHAHHRTLTPAEEAEFLRYLRERRGMRLREIAEVIRKSIAYVSRRLGVFEDPELDRALREGRLNQAAAQEILRAPDDWRPMLIEHAVGVPTDRLRALVSRAVEGGLSREEVERALTTGQGLDASARARRPARRRVGAADEARRNSPVSVTPPSPAFTLLRLVGDWSSTLEPDWRADDADIRLLDEAVALIRAFSQRETNAGRRQHPGQAQA